MLSHIRLIDFKSFVDEQVELAPLTLLVGANATGKSNFLEAIRFVTALPRLSFQDALGGLRGADINGLGPWAGIRGGAEEASRVGREVFSLETTWSTPAPASSDIVPPNTRLPAHISHACRCRTLGSPRFERESIRRSVESEPDVERYGGVKVRLGPDGGEPTWRSVEGPDAFRDQYSIINPFHWRLFLTGLTETGAGASASLLALDVALRRVSMLDIHPQQMRGYGRRGQPLGPQGQNISGVLADLCDDPEERRTLVDWIRELCAPEVQDLDFIEVKEAGDVLAVVVEQGQRRITARSLSDGTLRFLGLVVALRSAAPGSVLLIEEVDAWFHPTRLRVLVELLQAVTRAGSVQVIATTHSPTLLQWLSDEGLRDAVLFAISPDHEGTLMRRLADVPHFEAAKRSGIEELFSTGWLERAV